MTKLAESKVNTILIINHQRYNLKIVANRVGIRDRVPGIPQSRSRKSGTGTGTGTHFKIRDWDRDSNSKFAGSGTGTGTEI